MKTIAIAGLELYREACGWDSGEKGEHAGELLRNEIQKECEKLTRYQKRIVCAFYLEQLPWEEISKRVPYSSRQCRHICDRAMKRLEKYFAANRTLLTLLDALCPKAGIS